MTWVCWGKRIRGHPGCYDCFLFLTRIFPFFCYLWMSWEKMTMLELNILADASILTTLASCTVS